MLVGLHHRHRGRGSFHHCIAHKIHGLLILRTVCLQKKFWTEQFMTEMWSLYKVWWDWKLDSLSNLGANVPALPPITLPFFFVNEEAATDWVGLLLLHQRFCSGVQALKRLKISWSAGRRFCIWFTASRKKSRHCLFTSRALASALALSCWEEMYFVACGKNFPSKSILWIVFLPG